MRPRVVLAFVIWLLLPTGPAIALTTAITEPASGTRLVVDQTSPPPVHFAGTASSGSSVDLMCVSSETGSSDLTTVPIASNVDVVQHAFAVDATWPADPGLCEAYAVASGTVPTKASDLSGLTGALVYEASSDASIANGKVYDFSTFMAGSAGAYGLGSFGACGVSFGELVQLHEVEGSVFDCNGYPEATDPTAATDAPSIVVDGHPAYPTFSIGDDDVLSALPGWTGLTFAVSDDAGSFHVTSHEEIYRCSAGPAPDAFPPSSCAGFAPTGVGVEQDDKLSADGRTLVQDLRFVSEDDRAHVLTAVLNQTTADARQWRFPGTSAFQDYAIGDAPSVIAPAAATIRNRVGSGTPDPDITKGFGAITYAAQPAAEVFWDPSAAFTQRYPDRTIPAGKAARLEFVYTIAAGSSALAALTAAAEESIGGPPLIALTSTGSVTAAAYTLTGTVTAPETLNDLKVNGQPVPVATDGSFSTPATLAEGANPFTVTASDELGRVTTTTFSVILTTTGEPPPLRLRLHPHQRRQA